MGKRPGVMEGMGRLMDLLEDYTGKRVFVTGHTGFKGSWLCKILTEAGAEVTGYALETGSEPSLFSLCNIAPQIYSVTGDIRDLEALNRVFQAAQPEIVFHLAAQPIVRDSYQDPRYTYETNVMGTVNLLECIRRMKTPPRSVVVVTTDKVYWNREWIWGYREDEPLDGFDPYSNSKSCADLVTSCYTRSFLRPQKIAVSTVRAGNVIGGGDFANDRIIPDCVRAVQAGVPVTVRNPYSTRPYQHVLEPLFAYLEIARRQYHRPELAGTYNVGPDDRDCVTTGQLVELFCTLWGPGATWENRPDGGPHEASFLKLDNSKLKSVLGWAPVWGLREAVARTVSWTKTYFYGGDLSRCMSKQISDYIDGVNISV